MEYPTIMIVLHCISTYKLGNWCQFGPITNNRRVLTHILTCLSLRTLLVVKIPLLPLLTKFCSDLYTDWNHLPCKLSKIEGQPVYKERNGLAQEASRKPNYVPRTCHTCPHNVPNVFSSCIWWRWHWWLYEISDKFSLLILVLDFRASGLLGCCEVVIFVCWSPTVIEVVTVELLVCYPMLKISSYLYAGIIEGTSIEDHFPTFESRNQPSNSSLSTRDRDW